MKRLIIFVLTTTLLLTAFVPIRTPAPAEASNSAQSYAQKMVKLMQRPVGLHLEGVQLTDATGQRFYAAGLNVEMYRDYDGGCGWVTDGTYAIRGVMADRIKALGVNIVRLNYAFRFLNQAGNLARYLDMAAELAQHGIYVMPADHTYTGGVLTNSGGSFPTMKAIVDGMRERGLENYLVMGGWNEPGPIAEKDPQRKADLASWSRAYQNLLTYLRTTAAFNGIVVIDGTGWSTLLDVDAFKALQAFDAELRGGAANVIFSHHLYPNITELPAQIWTASNQVPLIVGELGQENPGASPLRPQYVKDVISAELNAGFANGHNGLFAWQWAWCDSNGMLQDDWKDASGQASNQPYTDKSPLTSHGTLWRDAYYSKLPGASAPPPTVIADRPTSTRTPSPTRTAPLPTNTPRPRSPTPIRTATTIPPSVTPLVTAAPTRTPSGIETYHILGKVGGWDVDLWIERIR